MKIIENKKLFGKINLIDIIIILVVILAGIVVYNVVFKGETTAGLGAEYYTTTCMAKFEDLPSGAITYLNIGSDVYDNETNMYIGKLKNVTSGDYTKVKQNIENNTFVESKVPGKENVYLEIEVSVSDQGVDLVTNNNYYIKVGKAISIRASNFAASGYITTIDRGDN